MNQIADTSQTTGGSTPSSTTPSTEGSTPSVERTKRILVPRQKTLIAQMNQLVADGLYHCKKWQYSELKKFLSKRMCARISREYLIAIGNTIADDQKIRLAYDFFEKNFPGRSPRSTYSRMRKMIREKEFPLIKRLS